MPKDKLSEEERRAIVAAIGEAEKSTSGEIRVHLENHCRGEVLDRAAGVFATLKMQQTELRNGVLFYLAIKDHKFAILGDEGINQNVPEGFWENIRDFMVAQFKKGEYEKGLSEGIKMAGEQLKAHFPYQSEDKNELPDDISFNKN